MKRKRIFVAMLCAFLAVLIAGCASKNMNLEDYTERYDISRFFVKIVDNQECNEYIVCYEKENGNTIEIVNMGIEKQKLIISGQRIFYSTGFTLISVDFEGENEMLLEKNQDSDISFEKITSTDNEWLYCEGRKMVEIHEDPTALDGIHYIPAKFKVKIDFSEYSETA